MNFFASHNPHATRWPRIELRILARASRLLASAVASIMYSSAFDAAKCFMSTPLSMLRPTLLE